MCSKLQLGGVICEVTSPVRSQPLIATFVEAETRKGPLDVWLTPKTGSESSEFIKLKTPGCRLGETQTLLGSYAAEVYSGGKPVEVKKEPAESKTLEL
jgi:hypothetical protein